MNKSTYVVTFAVGAVVVFAASYLLLKKKYEEITREEIESVKKTFENYHNPDGESESEVVKNVDSDKFENGATKEEIESYKKIAKEYVAANRVVKEPYQIPPEEFSEKEGYKIESLTYYSDGVLADDTGDIIHNINDTVGKDFASYFGEYSDECVYIRNDTSKTDYEILLDSQTYEETFDK